MGALVFLEGASPQGRGGSNALLSGVPGFQRGVKSAVLNHPVLVPFTVGPTYYGTHTSSSITFINVSLIIHVVCCIKFTDNGFPGSQNQASFLKYFFI